MKLGLIGNPLGHSWSPEIHHYLVNEDYQLWPLAQEKLANFLQKRDFDGLNVTIPYKQEVIPYLDEIDEVAQEIGAVNTIVNRNGHLIGHNTDYLGLKRLIESQKWETLGQEVAILGTGGASKAAWQAVKQLGGIPIKVSRTPLENELSYDELYQREFVYIINTTPVGMYPNVDEAPIDVNKLTHLKGLIDVVANPLRTSLMWHCQQRGIDCVGGLEMLVSQALAADELFLDQALDDSLVSDCVAYLLSDKQNIVLIGMPSCGKSTVGQLLAKATDREFVDTDEVIVSEIGMAITEYFSLYGEAAFREKEAELVKKLAATNGLIISTGGGVTKDSSNMLNLAYNGLIVWLDRSLDLLQPTSSRPLASKQQDLIDLYDQRKGLYQRYSDLKIDNNGSLEETVTEILKKAGMKL